MPHSFCLLDALKGTFDCRCFHINFCTSFVCIVFFFYSIVVTGGWHLFCEESYIFWTTVHKLCDRFNFPSMSDFPLIFVSAICVFVLQGATPEREQIEQVLESAKSVTEDHPSLVGKRVVSETEWSRLQEEVTHFNNHSRK